MRPIEQPTTTGSRSVVAVLALAGLASLVAGGSAWAQKIYSYENTTSGTIPLASNDNAACRSAFSRTFTVADSFTVATISLGLNVTHTYRGDLRVQLQAPSGLPFNPVIAQSGDSDNNYDILISTNSEGSVDDGSQDYTAEPYYNRMVNVSGMNFYTGNASGTWTLYVCDRAAGDVGTFNRARLVLTESATSISPVCTSTVSYEWGDNGNNVFSSATFGGVTMTLEETVSYPAGEAIYPNHRTTTATFGGNAGYYQMRFGTTTSTRESTRFFARFEFDVPVHDLGWGTLDCDTNGSSSSGWEDAVRAYGTDGVDLGGNTVPYVISYSASPSYQLAGDFVEGDTGNVVDTSPDGNSTMTFDGSVRSVSTEYWALDEPSSLASQRIGIADAVLCAFDYGDAPSSYGTSLNNGPKHVLGTRSLWLGANPPDGEADGQPNVSASGDNLAAIGFTDDEDGYGGLSFPGCPNDSTYTVPMTVNNSSGSTGYLVGYIDWNRDGDFSDANERSATVSVATGTTSATRTVAWSSVPANCGGETSTYARFRFTTSQARAESATDGSGVYAPDGEVEDYQISAGTLPVTIARIESSVDGGQLTVRWTTASEWANAGFRLWGKAEGGSWSLLDEVPAVQPDSFTPQHYQTTVPAGDIVSIAIEDVSLLNERRAHGPLEVGETAGEEPVSMTADWGTIRSRAGLAPARKGLSAQAMATGASSMGKGSSASREGLLLVAQPGIQRVTYEELLAAGIDLAGVKPGYIAVTNDGASVPRHVFSPAKSFGAGGYIEFVAEPQITLASPFDAFVLTVDRRKAVAVANLGSGGGELAITDALDTYQPDRTYSFSSPNGDPWFDQGLLAWGKSVATTRTFDLPDLVDGAVELGVKAWGYGGWPGSSPPDHHVVVRLNGAEVGDGFFDDISAWERSFDVTGLVQESGNVLEIEVPGDTGYQFDYIAFEGFSVRYPRRTVAIGQRFSGAVSGTGFVIGGFVEGQTVPIWLHDGKRWRRGEQTASLGQVRVPGGGSVWAAAEPALVKPGLSSKVPAALTSSKAEYVIVTHPAFAGDLNGLVELEESRGFKTEVVTVDEIYAAYSDHAPSAESIKRFLTTSWERGRLRYVLLVGADTTDPYDHLGSGSVSYVPTAYMPYVQYISYSPTDEVLIDADGDMVGEVPIGRLPVRTPTELHQVVAKLRAWESNLTSAGRNALLSSGVSDDGASLAAINRSYSGSLDSWNATLAIAEEQGPGAVRAAVLAAMSAGTPLVSFVGHSAMGQWDFSPILKWQDVAGFTNAGKPNFVAQWGCWNSYYVEPGIESLSARMLMTPDVGVAGAIGATTLTTDTSHQMLGNLFYLEINRGATTVGGAFLEAKRKLRGQAIVHDAILGMALLGDPAMSLPR